MSKKKPAQVVKRDAGDEKAKQMKRELIARETHYGQLTVRRHERSWKQMLLDIALPRMRAELEFAWHTYERVVDAKDFTISLLMDELDQAEDQYMRNMRTHIDNIDNLIVLCYDQIQDLRNESKAVIQNLYTAATFERNDIMGITKENEEYLKTMLYMLENQKKESEKLIRGEYLSKQEVEISRLTDVCSKFTEELEEKYADMYAECVDFLKAHIADCAPRKNEFTVLYEQDEHMQAIIKKLWEKIRKFMESIKSMKREYEDLQVVQARKIKELTRERSYFEEVFKTAKTNYDKERSMDDVNLTNLTLQSNDTIAFLEGIEKKGERLLKLSAICRKFETLEEKTMCFPLYAFTDSSSAYIDWSGIEGYRPELEMFCNRVGQVEASRFNVYEELEFLRRQNEELRREIHDYCACLNCDGRLN